MRGDVIGDRSGGNFTLAFAVHAQRELPQVLRPSPLPVPVVSPVRASHGRGTPGARHHRGDARLTGVLEPGLERRELGHAGMIPPPRTINGNTSLPLGSVALPRRRRAGRPGGWRCRRCRRGARCRRSTGSAWGTGRTGRARRWRGARRSGCCCVLIFHADLLSNNHEPHGHGLL